ncbi:MAG: BrnA antitoxin family protein [Rickettsiales bacterium]|jgi:uncharacterized protein (DUF4415 family)|nr:BrnA antitoxin family protein [Rickettsiales bacterium]
MAIVSYTLDEIKKLRGKTDWKRLRRMKDEDIDYSDIPPLTEADFARARRPGRPVKEDKKELISLRLDSDLLRTLRKSKNWQTGINTSLRGLLQLRGLL